MSVQNPCVNLRIGVPGLLGRNLIARRLPRFLQQHPNVGIELLSSDTLPTAEPQQLDASVHIGRVNDAGLISVRVASLGEIACASPDLIDMTGVPRSPDELDSKHCIGVFDAAQNRPREWVFYKRGLRLVISPHARLTVGDMEGAIEAAVGGAGFVSVLDLLAHAQIATGLLCPVLVDWSVEITHDVSVVYPKHHRCQSELEVFVRFLTGLFPCH